MTRLQRIGGAVVEAAWLSCAAFLPVYFQTSAANAFEAAKAGLLRAFALVALGGWVVHGMRGSLRSPIALPAAALLAVSAASTATSLQPELSLWGDPQFGVGLATLLSWATLGAALAANLRTRAQAERLVHALLLPTVPIALYALLQRAGLDPVTVALRETDAERVTATLGQPVYLGAYLGMLVPFAAARALQAWPRRGAALGWALLAGLHLLVALLTESRGPLLGAAAGLGVGFLALAARRGWRRPALAAVGAAVLLAAGLALLPRLTRASPDARLAHRLGATLSARGDSGQFRSVSWEIAGRVFLHQAPVQAVDGTPDRRDGWRRVLGFGLDVPGVVSQPFYVPAVNQITGAFLLTARYHHDLWDALVATGLAGLLATLLFCAALLALGVRALGLLESPRRRASFWAALVGGAALGGAGLGLALDGTFVFLGLQAGAVGGVGLFLFVLALRAPRSKAPGTWTAPLAAAALGAVTSHLLETSFSFTTVLTGLLTWLCAGLLVGLEHAKDEKPVPPPPRAALVDAALGGGVLSVLGFGLLGHAPSAPAVLGQALTRAGGTGALLALGTLGTLAALAVLAGDRRALGRSLPLAAGLALVTLTAAALPLGRAAEGSLRQVELRQASVTALLLAALGFLGLLAAGLAGQAEGRVPAWRTALAAVVGLAAVAAAGLVCLPAARFEVIAGAFQSAKAEGAWPLAEKIARRALQARPAGREARVMLARALTGVAGAAPERSREARFGAAEQAYRAVFEVAAYDSESAANLALLYGAWVRRAPDERREQLSPKLREAWAAALRLNPMEALLHCRWAGAQLALLEDAGGALASARRAGELRPSEGCAEAARGDAYAWEALRRAEPGRAQAFVQAAEAYRAALDQSPSPALRLALARAWLEAGRPAEARAVVSAARAAVRGPAGAVFERLAARLDAAPTMAPDPFPFVVAAGARSPASVSSAPPAP